MRHQKNHLFLGIFVISGIVLIGAAIVVLGARAGFRRGVTMESYFKESVTGLEEGSPVRFRGVKAGKVTEITTTRAAYGQGGDNYAMVRVEVYPEILGIPVDADFASFLDERIRDGLRVQLTETGFAGVAHIEALYVDDSGKEDQQLKFPWKPSSYYVPATASTLERFKESVQAVLNQLKSADIVGVVETAKDTFAKVGQALEDTDTAAVARKMADTLDNLDKTLANVDKTLGKADSFLEKPELHRAIADIDAAAADFRKLVQRTSHTVMVVQRAVGTRGRDLSAITDGLRELIDNLNSLSGLLERHPSLAVFGKPPKAAPIEAMDKER